MSHDAPPPSNQPRSRHSLDHRSISFASRWAVTLVTVGLLVQVLLPYRHDQPAHLVAGGALVLFLVVAISPNRLHRLGPYTEITLFALVGALSWLTEATFLGPFDLVDIAFTLAGSFLALAALPEANRISAADRRSTARMCVVLAAGALAYRYVLGIGAR